MVSVNLIIYITSCIFHGIFSGLPDQAVINLIVYRKFITVLFKCGYETDFVLEESIAR